MPVSCNGVGHRRDHSGVREHAGLRRVDPDVGGHGADLIADDDRRDGLVPDTPSVFCTVTAVIAVIPNTPSALKVFRSAWIPAPPPESLPAIVSARGRRGSAGSAIIGSGPNRPDPADARRRRHRRP